MTSAGMVIHEDELNTLRCEAEPNTYKCAGCGEVFEKEWTDEEARAEQFANFPELSPQNECIVCDDCYKAMGFE